MTSKPIKSFSYEIPNRGIMIFHELADGTFYASGTTHIYTREQYDAGVAKLLVAGGKLIKTESR